MTVTAEPVTLAEWAAHYARAGWEIFPGNPRTKAPLVTHGALDATSDPATVDNWWRQWPDALICHRLPDGVVLLDVDVRHGGDGTWTAIKAELGPLPTTRTHHSGRGDGGGHVWFTWPGQKPSTAGLDAWARERGVGHATATGGWSAGVDLLHHGHRYTILPPSLHPDTGNPYQWKGDPDLEVAPIPAGLAELLTAPEPKTNGHHPSDPAGDSIADWFTAHHSIGELLAGHGWNETSRDHWRHPEATNTHSATVRHGCLFVYTPTPGLPVTEPGDPQGLTSFRLYALLDHHGDMGAAASAARQLKDGQRPTIDLSWANGTTNGNGHQAEQQPAQAWPDPQPVIDIEPAPFPLEILPAWIGDHCEAVADRLQVPPDLCAQLALGVLATVTMGHARIHVTGTWVEPANLYLCTVMASGSGKSPADKYMVSVLRRLEAELIEQSGEDRKRAAHDRDVAERKAKRLREKAASPDAGEQAAMDAWTAAQRADAIEERPEPRLLAADVTPEMLAVLLDRHQGRIAIVSTEADLYDVVLGSYSRRPNISVLLKAWSGDEVIVDRKGGSGTAATGIRVPEALVTASITVQPVAFAAVRRNPELETKGFIPRFMHAWPADLVGTRDHSRTLDQRPLTTTTAYENEILRLGRQMAGWLTPADLHYDRAASQALVGWQQQLEGALGPGGDLAHLRHYIPKIAGSTARLAGLLHLADGHPIGETIGAGTVEKALAVGRYWLDHANIVATQSRDDVWGTERILAWIRDRKLERFTRRDVFCGNRRQFTDAAAVQVSLDLLTDVGWVREIEEKHVGSTRRNPIYEPHPQLLRCAQ